MNDCIHCGEKIFNRRIDSKYCSTKCQYRWRRQSKGFSEIGVVACHQCDQPVVGRRAGAKYCSLICGQKFANSIKPKTHREKTREYSRKYYAKLTSEEFLFKAAKARAAKQGILFELQLTDIIVPNRCPVLGLELKRSMSGKAEPNSPSLDRIIPCIGYVPGNICVISTRANTIKRDATLEELQAILEYVRQSRQ